VLFIPSPRKATFFPSGKDLWDALEAKFCVSDAGSELYLMEQLFDYKMVETVLWLNRLMRFRH
jgi:hypothetical protein